MGNYNMTGKYSSEYADFMAVHSSFSLMSIFCRYRSFWLELIPIINTYFTFILFNIPH
jgi:hypothetical protein